MKAVVWTDAIQIFVMVGSAIALVIKGVMDVGWDNIWQRNFDTGRIDFLEYDFKM